MDTPHTESQGLPTTTMPLTSLESHKGQETRTETETPVKTCTKCQRELPATVEFFYARPRGKHGLHSICRPCAYRITRAYALTHPTWRKERKREQWAKKSAEKKRIKALEPPKTHKTCFACKESLPRTNEYFTRNHTYHDKLDGICKQCSRRKNAAWMALHRNKVNATRKKQRKDHPQKTHMKDAIAWNRKALLRQKLRFEMLAAYGNQCACCGESHEAFLTIDHIYNDGAQHRRELGRGGVGLYAFLKREGFPKDRFALLCMNCNFAKRFGKVCPHTWEQ